MPVYIEQSSGTYVYMHRFTFIILSSTKQMGNSVLFLFQYLLVAQDYNQATVMLGDFGSYLQLWRGPHLQVEHVRIFYLSLQTWLGIASGQV